MVENILTNAGECTNLDVSNKSGMTYSELPTIQEADFGKCGAAQDFCYSEYYEMFQYLRHSESIEKYYEFTNSYFSCYSESINADEKTIELDRFRIKSGMTLLREMHLYGMPKKLCSHLSGMTDNNGLLRRKTPRNDVKNLSSYRPNDFPTLKKAAFTLAEVLITLGIIGVVAAMTIPNLYEKYYEKYAVNKLAQTYSLLSNAFRAMIDENGTIDTYGDTPEERLEKLKTLLPMYLKLSAPCTNKCTMEADNGKYKSRFSQTPISLGYGAEYKMLNGTMFKISVSSVSSQCVQNTSMSQKGQNEYGTQGVKIFYGTYQHACADILVDINGYSKPNESDKDLFKFKIVTDGIVPAGNEKEVIWVETFENQCLGKKKWAYSDGYCTAWVLKKKNMDYLRKDNLSW